MTCIYMTPGPHQVGGISLDYKHVPPEQVEEELANGWALTLEEAQAKQAQREEGGAQA